MVRPLSDDDQALLREAAAAGMTYPQMCVWLKERDYKGSTTLSAVANSCHRLGIQKIPVPQRAQGSKLPPEAREGVTCNFRSDGGTVITYGPNITTLEEALDAAEVDRKAWDVDRHVINFWDTSMRNNDGEPIAVRNYQIKVWLRRRAPVEIGVDRAIRRLEKRRKASPLRIPKAKPKGQVMAVFGAVDIHYGKYAWAPETGGHNWDLGRAREAHRQATLDTIRKTAAFGIARWVVPVGNDALHFQNPEGTTPRSGNVLDIDGRIAKVEEEAFLGHVESVELLLQVAPVDLLYVPDNHAPVAGRWLTRTMREHFRGNDHVTVDVSPARRKAVEWGANLIGFTHGHEIKIADLPRLMADEWPEAWARCRYRDWITGDKHHSKKLTYLSTDSRGSTTVRILPALCATDAWHYEHGFTGGHPMAESYLYHEIEGYAGHVAVYVPEAILTG